MLSINKFVEDTFCYKDYVCQVSKLQYMHAIGLKLNIFLKFKWKVLKQINPNLGGFSRGSFLHPCFKETTSLKTILSFELPYISCILYKRLLWPISVSTKNLIRRKKVYLKVFLNRFMLIQANIYLFKFNNKNTRKKCEGCSKLTIKTPKRRQWRHSGVFINFENISLLFLKILFRAYNFIIKSITRSLIIFKKPRKMTNDFFNHYIFVRTSSGHYQSI